MFKPKVVGVVDRRLLWGVNDDAALLVGAGGDDMTVVICVGGRSFKGCGREIPRDEQTMMDSGRPRKFCPECNYRYKRMLALKRGQAVQVLDEAEIEVIRDLIRRPPVIAPFFWPPLITWPQLVAVCV